MEAGSIDSLIPENSEYALPHFSEDEIVITNHNCICDNCGISFHKSPHKIKTHKNHFCGVDCRVQWQQLNPDRSLLGRVYKKDNHKCDRCGKGMYVPPAQFENSTNHFCCRKCADRYRSDNYIPPESNCKCTNCGKGFYRCLSDRMKKKNVFCNKKCYDQYLKKGRVVYCDYCGEKIGYMPVSTIHSQNFCDQKCMGKGRDWVVNKKTGAYLECLNCGKQVYRQLNEINRKGKSGRVFCTVDCRWEWTRKNNSLSKVRECQFCKTSFTIKTNQGKNMFCSYRCSANSKKTGAVMKCDNCGKESYVKRSAIKKHNKHFCDSACKHEYQLGMTPNKGWNK